MRRRPTWTWLLAQCVQHGLGIEWEVEQTGVRARDLDGAEVAGQRAKECGVTDRRPAALICQNEQIGLAAASPSCTVLAASRWCLPGLGPLWCPSPPPDKAPFPLPTPKNNSPGATRARTWVLGTLFRIPSDNHYTIAPCRRLPLWAYDAGSPTTRG